MFVILDSDIDVTIYNIRGDFAIELLCFRESLVAGFSLKDLLRLLCVALI